MKKTFHTQEVILSLKPLHIIGMTHGIISNSYVEGWMLSGWLDSVAYGWIDSVLEFKK